MTTIMEPRDSKHSLKEWKGEGGRGPNVRPLKANVGIARQTDQRGFDHQEGQSAGGSRLSRRLRQGPSRGRFQKSWERAAKRRYPKKSVRGGDGKEDSYPRKFLVPRGQRSQKKGRQGVGPETFGSGGKVQKTAKLSPGTDGENNSRLGLG